jgi:hypothetical protein
MPRPPREANQKSASTWNATTRVEMKHFLSKRAGVLQVILVILLLVGLPIAVWLDLDNLAEANLHHQARDLSSMISSVRAYYATNVVDRVLASPGTTKVLHD